RRFPPRRQADEIAEAAQPQAVFQILARADVEAALPQEYIAPIHGAGTGQAGNRPCDIQYGAPGADRHQVLDALQPSPQRVALVADRDVATGAADARIAKCAREPGDRGRLEHGVGVDGRKQIAAGKPRGCVDCRAAPAARAVADDHVHQATSARARSATARVSSVEPSSTTMISTGRK